MKKYLDKIIIVVLLVGICVAGIISGQKTQSQSSGYGKENVYDIVSAKCYVDVKNNIVGTQPKYSFSYIDDNGNVNYTPLKILMNF